MQKIPVLIGAALLISAPGFTEVLIAAEDYAVDSDVILESAVREVKSAPADTINVVGDTLKYAKDEVVTAAEGVAAVLEKDAHAKAQRDGELAVENAWNSSDDILFRSYKVNGKLGDLLLTEAKDKTVPSIDVSAFFKGIQFPKNTEVHYLPEFQCLFVRQTMDGLLAIETLLSEYRSEQKDLMGHQVEIETKFIEVSQNTMNELGFQWNFAGKNGVGAPLEVLNDLTLPAQDILAQSVRSAATALGGSAAGFLDIAGNSGAFQWNVFITALEQAGDSDVLCAPRVVTRDGSTAAIQVGEEQMFPYAFDVLNSDVSPFVEHTDWNLELMGVTLEVTPELREEGLIDLELHPKVIDIIGHDTYQVSGAYSDGDMTFRGATSEIPVLSGTLPYFRVREMETRLTVADGSTVGMGGLIYDKLETFRDKVPVLGSIPLVGRLFRSEGERSIKRNLMIFVTATQVDVDGRRAADLVLNK